MSAFDAYFGALTAADAAAALDVLSAELNRGVPADELIRSIVIPAQERVGQLWFDGSWTVADEHAATSVSEQALALLAPPRPRGLRVSKVVLACAEGEWHTLPARLARSLAEDPRLDVIMIGGSVPADHLGRHLASGRPAALALSCTMATNLIGAARSIDAAHAVGVPVVVGGGAWGGTPHRARQLGADVWLADVGRLAAAVEAVAGLPVATRPRPIPAEALLLDSLPRELLHRALAVQTERNPWMRTMSDAQRKRSYEDLGWLARHAAAAVACDDDTIVRGVVDWLLRLLSPRGVPDEAVLGSCDVLADVVEATAPLAAAVLRREAARAREAAGGAA